MKNLGWTVHQLMHGHCLAAVEVWGVYFLLILQLTGDSIKFDSQLTKSGVYEILKWQSPML